MGDRSVQIIGSVLVRDEDVFVAHAIRNLSAFCDRIYAHDHMSRDRTWDILRSLSRELDHLEVRRTRRAGDSQTPLEPYAGTRTWVLGVDGDELFDPEGLVRLRGQFLAGAHEDVFRLKAHVLNCEELDSGGRTASGYMAPPSRPITKLFNLAAVTSWTGCSHRLHDGHAVFRPGYDMESLRYLYDSTSWDNAPLRCLHVCFIPRSTEENSGSGRLNPVEIGSYDRTALGWLKRKLRPHGAPGMAELHRAGRNWKREWYARGERMTVDATPFLGNGV